MTIAPAYKQYPEAKDTGKDVLLRLPPYCGFPDPSITPGRDDFFERSHLPAPSQPLLPTARLLRVMQAGVERVFVEHSVYDGLQDNIYGSPDTYLEAGDSSDLDMRASVLCQAALAAPVLLWSTGVQQSPFMTSLSAQSSLATSAPAMPEATLRNSQASSQVSERTGVDDASSPLEDVSGSQDVGSGKDSRVEDSRVETDEVQTSGIAMDLPDDPMFPDVDEEVSTGGKSSMEQGVRVLDDWQGPEGPEAASGDIISGKDLSGAATDGAGFHDDQDGTNAFELIYLECSLFGRLAWSRLNRGRLGI